MKNDKRSGIYVIGSKVHPERLYVGSAKNFRARYLAYISSLRKGGYSPKLQYHHDKYGFDDFTWTVIEIVEPVREKLLEREQYYIDILHPYFNIAKIAGSTMGYTHTEETRKKISEHNAKHMLGKKHSEETIEKIKATKAERKLTRKKRIVSEETRKKISEKQKGKIISEEARIKSSERLKEYYKTHDVWNKGKEATPEIKERLRKCATGRKGWWTGKEHSEETKEKISKTKKGTVSWNKGIKYTEERKKKTLETRRKNKLLKEQQALNN